VAGSRLGEAVQARHVAGGAGHDGRLTDATGRTWTPVPLTLAREDGSILRGQRWGESRRRVVLIHEPGTDLDAWGDLPSLLASAGFAVEAFDLPGHGLSDDPWRPDRLGGAVQAIVFGRGSGQAATGVFIVAAGESATAGLRLAADGGIDGLVALSPVWIDADTRPVPTVPKLMLVGARDRGSLADAKAIQAECSGWTVLSTMPTGEQGTALLTGPWGGQVREQMVGFLRECVWTQRMGTERR